MSRKLHQGISELTKAALHRKLDAWRLLRNDGNGTPEVRHGRGAAYLSGYSIECKLKATAMAFYACRTLDELIHRIGVDDRAVYTHGLEALWGLMPALWRRFQASEAYEHFRRVNAWRPSWRYNPKLMSGEEAVKFLEAVERVYEWLENNRG